MNIRIFLISILISTTSISACSQTNSQSNKQSLSLEASNVEQIEDNLITAGQPTQADLEKLKSKGFSHIINLRTAGERAPIDEVKLTKELNIDYSHFPIAGSSGITKENAIKLDALLNQANGKVFLHCASSNRVGALLALREFYVKGKSAEEALEYGRKGGLKSLEGKVKELLSNNIDN